MKQRPILAVLCAAFRMTIAVAPSDAQVILPSPRALGPSTAVSTARILFHGSFEDAVAARELSDGKVLVVRDDSTAVLFDSTLHEVRRVGLWGDYGFFPQLWEGRADTTFLATWIGGLFTVIDPTGKVVDRSRVITIPNGAKWIAGGSPRQQLDSAGRFLVLSELPGGSSDSATLAWADFKGHHQDVGVTVRSGSRRGAAGAIDAIDVNDAWVGLPDGSVVVMRIATCRVEVISRDGQHTTQPALPCPRKTLTPAEIRARLAQAALTSILPPQWFGFEPAYAPSSMTLAPDGRIWIARNPFLQAHPYGDQVYDILDRSGLPIDTVTIPMDHRLIGLGRGVVYLLGIEDGKLERVRTR